MRRYIDPETGEYVDLHDPNRYSVRKRSPFGKRWAKMCIHMNSELALLPLTQTDFRVYHYMLTGLRHGNKIEMQQSTVSRELKITPAAVCRSVAHLMEMDLLRKELPGHYLASPHYVWRGENNGHTRAVHEWDSANLHTIQ